MTRKKAIPKISDEILNFDYEEDEVNGICETVIPSGEVIESFNFNDNISRTAEELTDNRKLQKQPYGITPPVGGEHFEIKRTFMFRRSTVRMLNKLKAEHVDENVYLSSIVDEAIKFYYDYIFKK